MMNGSTGLDDSALSGDAVDSFFCCTLFNVFFLFFFWTACCSIFWKRQSAFWLDELFFVHDADRMGESGSDGGFTIMSTTHLVAKANKRTFSGLVWRLRTDNCIGTHGGGTLYLGWIWTRLLAG